MIKDDFFEIFETAGITDIGRLLLGSFLTPFLCGGDTLASFQSDRNTPVFMDWLNITVNEGASTSAAIFNNFFGILSRPTDLLSSIDFNNLQTVAIVGVCIEKVLFVGVR